MASKTLTSKADGFIIKVNGFSGSSYGSLSLLQLQIRALKNKIDRGNVKTSKVGESNNLSREIKIIFKCELGNGMEKHIAKSTTSIYSKPNSNEVAVSKWSELPSLSVTDNKYYLTKGEVR
ncbi:hypothetical protein TNIN_339941 [Trichonephila inaurata madagascariensis]|uniref:Uncharacterized protein n=1 Tax=Trichonephila inaurata madagascariensis TaxID=2747483 RepID=A0A8X6WRN7_9ARAC|nr:hypothetical protein TNIN_339941 [Trichonephila inaurata madagascariensis]